MNLLDFLQSASNATASNVSGPVDLVSMLLNKLGVPVQNAVGGSEWMKQKGLMKDVPQSGSSLAGETFGLLAPIGVAAKAPQIAAGLLKAQENAAIPRQMNPQMGAIVYHGSPHKFDKFDSSKIGTGEGAQAYGHGLYLADAPDVAKEYQKRLSNDYIAADGTSKSYGTVFQAAMDAAQNSGSRITRHPDQARAVAGQLQAWVDAGKKAETYLKHHDVYPELKPAYEAAANAFAGVSANKGNLYKVDLPDSAIAKMLDWDKPLSQQAPEVKKLLGLDKTYKDNERAWDALGVFPPYKGHTRDPSIDPGSITGAQLNSLFGTQPAASAFWKDKGIPGIRYLDGGSRNVSGRFVAKHPQGGENVFNSAGELDAFIKRNPEFKPIYPQQTSNYVVFPGAEDLLKILERNGAGL
jgi:hypothetical protein